MLISSPGYSERLLSINTIFSGKNLRKKFFIINFILIKWMTVRIEIFIRINFFNFEISDYNRAAATCWTLYLQFCIHEATSLPPTHRSPSLSRFYGNQSVPFFLFISISFTAVATYYSLFSLSWGVKSFRIFIFELPLNVFGFTYAGQVLFSSFCPLYNSFFFYFSFSQFLAQDVLRPFLKSEGPFLHKPQNAPFLP